MCKIEVLTHASDKLDRFSMGNAISLKVNNDSSRRACVVLLHNDIVIGTDFIDPGAVWGWDLNLPKKQMSVVAFQDMGHVPKLDLCAAMWASEMKFIGSIGLPDMAKDLIQHAHRLDGVHSGNCRLRIVGDDCHIDWA